MAGTVLGHEFVGRRCDSWVRCRRGQLVTGLYLPAPSRAVSAPIAQAGRSSQCPDRALFGYSGVYQQLHGGQAELVRVPVADRCLKVLPESVSDDAAVFVADMLPTGYSAVRRATCPWAMWSSWSAVARSARWPSSLRSGSPGRSSRSMGYRHGVRWQRGSGGRRCARGCGKHHRRGHRRSGCGRGHRGGRQCRRADGRHHLRPRPGHRVRRRRPLRA